jgi:hypothetical protein
MTQPVSVGAIFSCVRRATMAVPNFLEKRETSQRCEDAMIAAADS